MTVITKSTCDKKPDKSEVQLIPPLPKTVEKDVEAEVMLPTFYDIRIRQRRINLATTVCALITAVLVLITGVVGGYYMYRQFMKTKVPYYRSWCTIPYGRDVMSNPNSQNGYTASSLIGSAIRSGDANRQLQRDDLFVPEFFREDFEIDIEFGLYEKIEVPDFSGGRRGRFIHDFSTNKTAIIDLDGQRCFVKMLNRTQVLPPHSLSDLVAKMKAGYYAVDTQVVRETMKVVRPPVTDFQSIGYYITRECHSLPTYMLESVPTPKHKHGRGRRTRRTADDTSHLFAEFAGKKIYQLEILDDDDDQNY